MAAFFRFWETNSPKDREDEVFHQENVSTPDESSVINHVFRIALVGDSGSGKTSLAQRFTENTFNDETSPTDKIQYSQRIIDDCDMCIKVQLWDTPAYAGFSPSSMFPEYFHFVDAVVIVYDATESESFLKIPVWLAFATKYGEQRTPIFIVSTKNDKWETDILNEMAKEFANKRGMEMFVVSAKSGLGVEELFRAVARELMKNAPPKIIEATNDSYCILC